MSQTNLQAVLADLEPMKPEKQLKVEKDRELEQVVNKLLASFAAAVDKKSGVYRKSIMDLDRQKISARVVSEFATRLILNYGSKVGDFEISGIINGLVQYSYLLGHNNFDIVAANAIDNFGRGLIGEPGRLLQISVTGDLGDNCFSFTSYIAASIRGNIGEICYIDCSLLDFHGSASTYTHGILGCTIRHKSQEVLDMIRKACRNDSYITGLKNSYLLMSGNED